MPPDTSPPLDPLTLSIRQRDLIVDLGLAPPEILAKIRFAAPLGDTVVLNLGLEELKALGTTVFDVLGQAESKSLQDELSEICRDIATLIEPHVGPAIEALNDILDSLPPALRDEVVELLANGELDSPEELLEAIDELTLEHARGSAILPGNVSVPQFDTLVSCDWDDDGPGLCMNPNLPLEQLQGAPLLLNTRIFLQAVVDAGAPGVRATAKGNLNRKFVMAMFEAMHWPPRLVEDVRFMSKVVNEGDIRDLGLIRFLLETARLIRKRKGAFHITKNGSSLLDEERAGPLYARLFRAFFREYDLSGEDFGPECPVLQDTIAYSLFVLSREAVEWRPQEKLVETAIVGAAAKEYLQNGGHPKITHFHAMVHWRLFKPLAAFGLVEFEDDDYGPFGDGFEVPMRKTPLFDAFLSFNLPDPEPQEPQQ